MVNKYILPHAIIKLMEKNIYTSKDYCDLFFFLNSEIKNIINKKNKYSFLMPDL